MMGLMFYIRPDQDFDDALKFGMDYFKKRYNAEPIECIVHPEQKLPNGLSVVVKAEPYILIRNFWLIKDEKEDDI